MKTCITFGFLHVLFKNQDKEEMCSRLEELRQKMISTSQTNLDRVITKKEKEWQDKLREREQELVIQFQQQRQDLEVKLEYSDS